MPTFAVGQCLAIGEGNLRVEVGSKLCTVPFCRRTGKKLSL
jgi:hypothetical protein